MTHDTALQLLEQALQAHQRSLEELEKALMEFEAILPNDAEAPEHLGNPEPQLLSIAEVIRTLGMGKSWTYRRLKSGEIPSVKLGRTIKVKREDGQQIAYSSSRDGNHEIWVENVDGSGTPRQITHTENTQDGVIINSTPAWSVDGKIAYVSNKDNLRTHQRDIYVANADGTGEPTRLTNTPTANKWSPRVVA